MHAWLCIEAMISISITGLTLLGSGNTKGPLSGHMVRGIVKTYAGMVWGPLPTTITQLCLYCTWQLEHLGKKTTCSLRAPLYPTLLVVRHTQALCLWGSRAIHLCWFNHLGLAARKVGIGLNVKASLEGNKYKSLTQSHFRNTNVEFSARTLHHCR